VTVSPTATIRTMILLLPDYLPSQSLNTAALDRQFGIRCTPQPRFWARPGLRLWQRSAMIGLRKGRPAWCAGGPARLLDLTGIRYAAGVGAALRHEVWSSVVHGTRPAYPWHSYLAKHLADPDRYSREDAETDFQSQPRVNAMRIHNAVDPTAGILDLSEIEMLQAGSIAYQHFSAATAVCADALLRDDGTRLAPASDALTHRTTYLEHALRMVDTLPDEQRLIAVTL
jgi:hypothetical protein